MHVLERLSFQLYSSRNFPPLERQLEALASLGFANVEPYGGLFADFEALRAGLKRHGLNAPSAHVGLDRLRTDRDRVSEQARELGTRLVVVPAIPPEERPNHAEGWRGLGRELEGLQAAFAEDGLALAWHNHDFEFRKLPGGEYPLDLMFAAAPGLKWEADLGWLHVAGEEPRRWVGRYADRMEAVHVKDVAAEGEKPEEDGWTDVGAGVIDWPRLVPALIASAADLYVLEHDNPADFEAFARRSRAAMADW